MKCGVWSVLLCLCLSVSMSSLYGREVTVGYARLRGGMGATFCHLAGSLGNDRFGPNPSREVTEGHRSKFLPFGGPSAAD